MRMRNMSRAFRFKVQRLHTWANPSRVAAEMHAELEYVSVGCSRTPHAVDWSGSGTVAYAAHETVALAREAEVCVVS